MTGWTGWLFVCTTCDSLMFDGEVHTCTSPPSTTEGSSDDRS